MKSTVEEIRARFDADVERFSSLQTGQCAAMDSLLVLDTLAATAAACVPDARRLLDVGCGAGNFSLKLRERLPTLHVTLLDLSRPMLDRAVQRVGGGCAAIQADIREADLGEEAFDLVVAAAVLHHLRGEDEWRAVYAKLFRALAPGGSLWVFDLVDHGIPAVAAVMRQRYGDYLAAMHGPEGRDRVFAYSDKEDSPRPVPWQLDRMREAGFAEVEVLHKNGPFAAFGGVKAGRTG
ncbi:MAG: class I SAM-dependent methyltransferase [Gemmataceae bacterium]|nr:class I SAM-dependent methyltransferase [Gemmataceae bacterium]